MRDERELAEAGCHDHNCCATNVTASPAAMSIRAQKGPGSKVIIKDGVLVWE